MEHWRKLAEHNIELWRVGDVSIVGKQMENHNIELWRLGDVSIVGKQMEHWRKLAVEP